jgi:hypothetical protein
VAELVVQPLEVVVPQRQAAGCQIGALRLAGELVLEVTVVVGGEAVRERELRQRLVRAPQRDVLRAQWLLASSISALRLSSRRLSSSRSELVICARPAAAAEPKAGSRFREERHHRGELAAEERRPSGGASARGSCRVAATITEVAASPQAAQADAERASARGVFGYTCTPRATGAARALLDR